MSQQIIEDPTKELSNKEKKALKKQQKAAKKAERLGGVTQNNIPADILERQRLAQEKKLQNKQLIYYHHLLF